MSNNAQPGSAPALQEKKPNRLVKLGREFKEFVCRDSLIDVAVAVIVGAAFSAIITSLVNDLFMPFIAAATGKNLSDLAVIVGPNPYGTYELAKEAVAGGATNVVIVNYGNFIQAVVNFLIICLIMFAVLKVYIGIRKGSKDRWFGYTKLEYKALKKQGLSRSQIREQAKIHAVELAAKAKAEAEEKAKNSVEGILKDIRVLLEKNLSGASVAA